MVSGKLWIRVVGFCISFRDTNVTYYCNESGLLLQLHSSSPDTFEPNSSYRVQNGRCRISHQFLGGAVTGYKLEVGQQSNKGYLVLDEGKPPANAVSWPMSCEIPSALYSMKCILFFDKIYQMQTAGMDFSSPPHQCPSGLGQTLVDLQKYLHLSSKS